MIMTLIKKLLLGLSCIILSCGQVDDRSEKLRSISLNDSFKIENFADTLPTTITQKSKKYDYKLTLQFDNVAVLFSSYRDFVPKISKLNTDSAEIFIEYAGQISYLQLSVWPNLPFDSIMIEQKFENAVTLNNMDERFVHLKKWWHIDSDWQAIQFDNTSRIFKIMSYDHKEREEIFNDLNKERFNDIKTEALSYETDKYYGPIINNATEINMLPLEFWASKYIIKITIITLDKNIEKYIVIRDTFGC